MNKRIFWALLLCIPLLSYGQQRNAKEIEKIIKSLTDVEAIQTGFAFQAGNFLKMYQLSEATPSLNELEKDLLSKYDFVGFGASMQNKPIYAYFVKDSENKRGLVGLDGKTIVPPLSGIIGNIPNGKDFGILMVGELSAATPADLLLTWGKLSRSKEAGMIGLFSALVIDAAKPSIHSAFPLDKYIFLSLGFRGQGQIKYDIFTLKQVGDDALWGVCDVKGKEIIPNKYTGFSRSTHFLDTENTGIWGKWKGTNEMDMTEALNYSKDLKAETQRRRAELAGTIGNVGEAMIATANTIETVQNINAEGTASDGTKITGDLPTQYSKWASLAERHYNSLTNLGLKGKNDGKDAGGTAGQGMSSSNYTQMKKSLREAQSEMKRIRQKAKKEGINIQKSEYEDIQVKY